MTEGIQDLQLPLCEEDARSLKLGQMVTLTGLVFTGRSRFHIRAIEEGLLPPLDYERINAFFHVGPVMRRVRDRRQIVSIEPTSSIRFERYSGAVIRKLRLRTLIGKTTMGDATAQALREVGGVHLSKIGVCGNQLVPQVKRVCAVHFLEELGATEATWVFEVERFGPFFVDMDARGGNYFDALDETVRERMTDVYDALGVGRDYRYTEVTPQHSVRRPTDPDRSE